MDLRENDYVFTQRVTRSHPLSSNCTFWAATPLTTAEPSYIYKKTHESKIIRPRPGSHLTF